jgi:hypothetical protein
MTEAVIAALEALREIVQDLEASRSRLLEVIARLKPPSQEGAPSLGEEEMDLAAELRSILECVLHDSLQPAIRDLRAAAKRE